MYLQQKFKYSKLAHRARGVAVAAALLACAAAPALAKTVTINAATHGSVAATGGSNGAENFSNMFTGKAGGVTTTDFGARRLRRNWPRLPC